MMAKHLAPPHYWETPEFRALQAEDADAYAEFCRVTDFRLVPTDPTENAAYQRDVIAPARERWAALRIRTNAARRAGVTAEKEAKA